MERIEMVESLLELAVVLDDVVEEDIEDVQKDIIEASEQLKDVKIVKEVIDDLYDCLESCESSDIKIEIKKNIENLKSFL